MPTYFKGLAPVLSQYRNIDESWGLKPILFRFKGIQIESYPFFITLALVVGFIIYACQLKKDNIKSSNSIYIAIFALLFGAIGSKLPILIIYWNDINAYPSSYSILTSGRTVVGGLIGGAAGTFLAKRLFHIKARMGNQLAIPVSVGMAVGRIGCILRGCCYGRETTLPWGINLGDNIRRHPTQAYELIFDLILALYLSHRKKRGVEDGQLFTIFLNCYLSFRFIIEFIRTERIAAFGLTSFQILCILSLIYINRKGIIAKFKVEVQSKIG